MSLVWCYFVETSVNADHIAWCETDRHGSPINKGSLAYDPQGSSNLVNVQFGDQLQAW